ncbi:uncharacterized protein LOC133328190 isoform X2 [Musca vetustissima]|uniref:uncharacterized protein LOC133328190 isoform X2 n=1 Tax=Musca vetustissima TaxID=27455 RepID=UPI002AB76CA4|nr:uncharacterized protein LOC133328190 isoform X2 [Musca vetustissima]
MTKSNFWTSEALQGSVKLEGDVITANGSILSGYEGHDGQSFSGSNISSMCSCRCACFSAKRHKRHQMKGRRSPSSHMRHLLPEVVPMQDLGYDSHSLNHPLDGVDVVDTSTCSQPQLLKRNVSLLSFQYNI